jgi:hypothetical protein
LALQTPKFYLAGSKRARKSGFLRSIDRKNPQFEQALREYTEINFYNFSPHFVAKTGPEPTVCGQITLKITYRT